MAKSGHWEQSQKLTLDSQRSMNNGTNYLQRAIDDNGQRKNGQETTNAKHLAFTHKPGPAEGAKLK
eukprot:11200743-Lingulodinium_polyedra.AAC.1